MLRPEIIDRLRLLGRRAPEERRAVDHRIDAAHRGWQRLRSEQIALGELNPSFAQVGGARRIAHQGAHLVAALGKSLGESAPDLPGRSGDEDLHVPEHSHRRADRRLDKSDKRARMVARRRARNQTRPVQASAAHRDRITPSASTASALSALFTYDCDRDSPGVVIPRPEIQLVVRFGPSSRNGLDVHAFGARQRVHRKLIRRGQRSVTARLALGAPEAVLGVPASEMAGRIVALEDLWGDVAMRRLCARLADARDTAAAAAILESAIAERLATAAGRRLPARNSRWLPPTG